MKNNKSFTLIEIMSVVLIIAIVSGFIIINTTNSRIQSEIARGKAFSLSMVTSLAGSFVSEWKFDSGTVLVDTAANANDVKDTWGANDGTINGTPTVRGGTNCISGRCLSFNGSTDFVDCGSGDSLHPTRYMTFAVWVKPGSSQVQYADIFGNHNKVGIDGYVIQQDGNLLNKYYFVYGNGSAWQGGTFTTQLNTSQWNFYVAQKNNTIIKIYLNGSYVNQENVTGDITYAANHHIFIGLGYASTRYFNGLIDDVRIFNAALPVSQINQMYYSGLEKLLSSGQITKEEYNQRIVELNNNLIKHE
jgi:type II secretory pathway pseudopilin PulG